MDPVSYPSPKHPVWLSPSGPTPSPPPPPRFPWPLQLLSPFSSIKISQHCYLCTWRISWVCTPCTLLPVKLNACTTRRVQEFCMPLPCRPHSLLLPTSLPWDVSHNPVNLKDIRHVLCPGADTQVQIFKSAHRVLMYALYPLFVVGFAFFPWLYHSIAGWITGFKLKHFSVCSFPFWCSDPWAPEGPCPVQSPPSTSWSQPHRVLPPDGQPAEPLWWSTDAEWCGSGCSSCSSGCGSPARLHQPRGWWGQHICCIFFLSTSDHDIFTPYAIMLEFLSLDVDKMHVKKVGWWKLLSFWNLHVTEERSGQFFFFGFFDPRLPLKWTCGITRLNSDQVLFTCCQIRSEVVSHCLIHT